MEQAGSPFLTDTTDMIDQLIAEFHNGLSICSVAKVTAVTGNKVSVQPLVKYFDKNNGFLPYPILNNVPVTQNFVKNAKIKMPLSIGDTGIILWFDREVKGALETKSVTTPSSGSMNNVAACVFLPLLSNDAPSLNNDGFELDVTGKTKLKSSNGMDMESVSVSLLTQLINLTDAVVTFSDVLTQLIPPAVIGTLTSGNYAIPVAGAATQLKTQATQVKTNLTTFKG